MIVSIALPSHPVAILDLVDVIHVEQSRPNVRLLDVQYVAIPREAASMHLDGLEARFRGRSGGLHEKDMAVLGRRHAGIDDGDARAFFHVLLRVPGHHKELVLVVLDVARIDRRAESLRVPALRVEQVVVVGRRPLVSAALDGHLMVDIGDDFVNADVGQSVIQMLDQARCATLLQLDVLIGGDVVPFIGVRA